MSTKILNGLKVLCLALALSLGIGYTYAWVGPSGAPTGGNVATPINTSSFAQTKAGDLSVQNFNSSGALTAASVSSTGNVTAPDFFISSIGKLASSFNTTPEIVSGTATTPNTGSPNLWAYAYCTAGKHITGCSGVYNFGCSGSWFCDYQGAIPVGDYGCAANAFVNQNTVVTAYAYCR